MSEKQVDEKDEEISPAVELFVERVKKLTTEEQVEVLRRLLEMMGANPAGRDSWCLGGNLFEPDADRRRVLGAWNELGVWTPEGVVRVPLSLFEFDVELYSYEWDPIVDDREALLAEAATLERLGADCNRFLK